MLHSLLHLSPEHVSQKSIFYVQEDQFYDVTLPLETMLQMLHLAPPGSQAHFVVCHSTIYPLSASFCSGQ